MDLYNKTVIYSLKNEIPQRHVGQYFQIVHFNDQYYLYYNSENRIKLVISKSLRFLDAKPVVVVQEAPGGSFCIIEDDGKLKMLCGAHISNNESGEILIPDLVWPDGQKKILDWNVKRDDRKNGLYLLSSTDGFVWNEECEAPVMHKHISSDSCKLGEVGFDTSPSLIKHNEEFYYYGRLNPSLDERRMYVSRSKDLINWSSPEQIKIINENDNDLKKNFYMPVVFKRHGFFYMFCPYFECCGTPNRDCKNGATILMKSNDGIYWEIKESFFPHEGKYRHRVNDIIFKDNQTYLFFRENFWECHQDLVYYNIKESDLK